MAFTLPDLPVTGTTIDTSWGVAVRAALNESAAAKVTTSGDIVYATGAGTLTRLGIGSSGKALVVSGGVPAWGSGASPYTPGSTVEGLASGNDFAGTAAAGCAWSPNGRALAVWTTATPFLYCYPYDPLLGFGLVSAAPVAPAAYVRNVAWSPDSAYIVVSTGTSPYIEARPWSGTAIGTKLSDPASLPAAAGFGIAFNAAGTLVAMGVNASPYVQMWAWSAGFGAKATDLAGGNIPSADPIRGLAFNAAGTALYGANATTPYVHGWPISGGAWGSKFSNPGSLPSGAATQLAINAAGDLIVIGLTGSPYLEGYAVTASAIGTKLTAITAAPGSRMYGLGLWESGSNTVIVGHESSGDGPVLFGLSGGQFANTKRHMLDQSDAAYGGRVGTVAATSAGGEATASVSINPVTKELAIVTATHMHPFIIRPVAL